MLRRIRAAAYVVAVLAVVLIPFALFGSLVEGWAAAAVAPDVSRVLVGLAVFGLLAADILAPVPSSLVCIAASAALGIIGGTLLAACGLTCGCLMGLLLARRVGTEASRTLLGPDQFDRLTAALRRRGLALLAVCRPVPVLAEASVLVAGASRMPLRRTIGVTAAANVGVAGVYVWLGASAGDAVPFLLVFAASCLLPAASWALARSLRLVTVSGR